MDLVPPLERTFQHARTLIARVRPEKYDDAISLQLRPGRFGPEQEAPPDADATARLAAFLGRKP